MSLDHIEVLTSLGILALPDRAVVVSSIERLEVEASLRLGAPEADVVGVDGVVAFRDI